MRTFATPSQRLLLIVLPGHVVFSTAARSVLRDETCTSICRRLLQTKNAPKAHRHQAQRPLKARPANDLHGLRCISTRARLHPQTTGKPNTRRRVRAINKHIPTTYLAPAFSPSHPASSRSQCNGREKPAQQLTTMCRTSVVVVVCRHSVRGSLACVLYSSWTTTRANMSRLRRRWCLQTRLEGSETLQRTRPPPPACLLPG